MTPSILGVSPTHNQTFKPNKVTQVKVKEDKGAAAGFYTCLEQPQETELIVEGKIPEWVQGVLFRTGPGRFEVGEMNISHWFDGKGLNHRFSISGKDQSVKYRSRESCAIEVGKQAKMNRSSVITFAQPTDPCERLFSKFSTAFHNASDAGKAREASDGNISVVLVSSEKGLIAKTDNSMVQRLDPTTLEPLEIFNYGSLGPGLDGPLSAAHGATIDGITYNYVLNLGPKPKYTIFSHKGYEKGQTKVLMTIDDAPAAYLHSLAATANYVVLSVWQADYKNFGLEMLWRRNVLQGIGEWTPKRSPKHYIINRFTGKLKAQITTDAFFCFHHINAFEEGDDVVLDLLTYDNTNILEGLRMDKLRSFDADKTAKHHYTRLLLPLEKGDCSGVVSPMSQKNIAMELPVVHPSFQWKKARYAYGIHRSGNPESKDMFADTIIRLDMDNGERKLWYEKGQVPGEPIFVAAPSGKEEEGALLVIALDVASQSSSLVVLDAQTMMPLARANINIAFPNGFHGAFQT